MTPLPGRRTVATLLLAAGAALVGLDLAGSAPIDPLAAPAPAALGSGAPPTGAHCTRG